MNNSSNIKTYIDILPELEQIMVDFGINLNGEDSAVKWLTDLIILAIYYPDSWQNDYLDSIGKRENLTHKRVCQMLYKTAWDNWNKEAKAILEAHFGHPIQTQFKYVKPDHIEFISLISDELRKKFFNS